MTRAIVRAAAWWDADRGPPDASLLPRAVRAEAGFATRILVHVLSHVVQDLNSAIPWVLAGTPSALRSLDPEATPLRALMSWPSPTIVLAEHAVVAMALHDAIARLADHPRVLVAFVSDTTPPYHEALASVLVLARDPADEPAPAEDDGGSWVLQAPVLRRTSSPPPRDTPDRHPLWAAQQLARAVLVGQPTVQSEPATGPRSGRFWRIELQRRI